MKYDFIATQQETNAVSLLCEVLGVSRSGYYAWCQRGESTHARAEQALGQAVADIFTESHGRYGSPRVWQALRQQGQRHSRKRIARLMAQRGLVARRRRRTVHTTQADPTQPVAANLLARDFQAPAPDRKWVGDIKYIATDEGDLYLAALVDLYSRRVVGWAMEDTLAALLTVKALAMALQQRQPTEELLAHSDQGRQYSATDYRALLQTHACVQSMSRKGNCWDNAVMESFFSTLEFECLRGKHFVTRAQARLEVFTYIETFYNRKRLHSTLGYVSPATFEAQRVPISPVHKIGAGPIDKLRGLCVFVSLW